MFHPSVPSIRMAPGAAVSPPPSVRLKAARSKVCVPAPEELSFSDRMVAAAVFCACEAARLAFVVLSPPPAMGSAV
jgi:hypothetical protein